jgi:hypothetical protein
VLFGGSPNETLSGRSYRQGVVAGHPQWRRSAEMINRLFLDPKHCKSSHELDVDFARAILEAAAASH